MNLHLDQLHGHHRIGVSQQDRCQAFVLTICFTLAIAFEAAPDNFQVLSVAQLIFDRTISVRELVRAR